MKWLAKKFAKQPELAEANQKALQAGYNAGDIHEMFQGRYEVAPCDALPTGTYRNIMGNEALEHGPGRRRRAGGAAPLLRVVPDHAGLGHPRVPRGATRTTA